MLEAGNKILNRYEIIRHLGSGGMGDVYLVTDTFLNNQQLALKLLKADFLTKEGSKERFLREVELARQATHSNVLRTFDVGEDPIHGIYFTMEYANGNTLAKLLENGAIKYQQVLIIIQQLLAGLEEIHRSNIVHRDLKPSNIIINQDGLVQIMDFGIARSVDSQLTTTSEVLGSGPYMSPEQWKGGAITAKTDLYGVGVILFELITGNQPFYADTAPQQMYKHLVELPQPKLCKPNLPRWLNQLTVALLAKESEDRPNSASEVLQIIQDKIFVEKILANYRLGAGGSALVFEDRGSENSFSKASVPQGNWAKFVGLGFGLLTLLTMGFVGKSIVTNSPKKQVQVAPVAEKKTPRVVSEALFKAEVTPRSKEFLEKSELVKDIPIKDSSAKVGTSTGTYNKVKFKTLEKLPIKEQISTTKTKADFLAEKNNSTNMALGKLKSRLQQMTQKERQEFFKK